MHRSPAKGRTIPFQFRKSTERWLRAEARRRKLPMVAVLEAVMDQVRVGQRCTPTP